MKKRIYEEMGGTYSEVGDYRLPDLVLPAKKEKSIGIWGQRHLRYIKQHKRVFCTNLLTSGKLNDYLADIDERAEEMFSRLVSQLAQKEGITEALKADDQMEWVGKMNNVRACANEIVLSELIYN